MTDPVVPDAVEAVVEGDPPPDHDLRPPWVDDLIHAVEAIPDAVLEALPAPVPVETVAEITPGGDPAPEHHEIEADETPESKPWTHKMPFRK